MGKAEEKQAKKVQIVAVHESDGDWRTKAKELNVAVSTAYRWVNEGVEKDNRGGRQYNKVEQHHRDHMVTLIEENPKITLSEIRSSLSQTFQLSICNQTVSNHLDSLLYSLKAVRFEPERANTAQNKLKRKAFVESLLQIQSLNQPIVFMDETNFNIHISRRQGRSKVGKRCTTVAAGSKGANIHLIGGISNLGWMAHTIKRGSFRKPDAVEWIKVCLRAAMSKHGGPVVMVMDNAPCHSNVEELLVEDDLKDCKILKMSPYSPMLNPIENVWSVIKSEVKRELSVKLAEILSSSLNGPVCIKEQRLRALENLVRDSLASVTPMLCTNCIASIQSKFAAAINLEDMTF